MKNWKNYLIIKELKVSNAINMLDSCQCIFVVDEGNILLGTITDRDIRKALLNQISKDDPVTKIMNSNPKVLYEPVNYKKIREVFKDSFYEHYPLLIPKVKLLGFKTIKN